MSLRLPRIAARAALVALCFCTTLFAAPAFTQIASESESNNTESTADGPVGSGTRVTGSLSKSSDIDWFYFDVPAAGAINIVLGHAVGNDFDWDLYRGTGSAIASGRSGSTPDSGTCQATVTGRHVLKLTAYRGSGAYTLDVTFGGGSVR